MPYNTLKTIGALRLSDMSPTDRLVLVMFAMRADRAGQTWVGAKRLSEDTGFSERTVRASVGRLFAGGWLEEVKHKVGGSRTVRVITPEATAPLQEDHPLQEDQGTPAGGSAPPAGGSPDQSKKPSKEQSILSGIDSLAPRTRKALAQVGLTTPEALTSHSRTTLKALGGIGPKTLDEIEAMLKEEGLALLASPSPKPKKSHPQRSVVEATWADVYASCFGVRYVFNYRGRDSDGMAADRLAEMAISTWGEEWSAHMAPAVDAYLKDTVRRNQTPSLFWMATRAREYITHSPALFASTNRAAVPSPWAAYVAAVSGTPAGSLDWLDTLPSEDRDRYMLAARALPSGSNSIRDWNKWTKDDEKSRLRATFEAAWAASEGR